MEVYHIDAERPDSKYISKIVETFKGGGLVVYPTDVNYGLGCKLNSPAGVKNLNILTKKLGRNKLHTIICRDFSDVGKYAVVPNDVFRAMKKLLPGPYTLILEATTLVPKVCQTRRSTIGVRIIDTPVMNAMLSQIRGPILNFTALPSEEKKLIDDPKAIEKLYHNNINVLVDVGKMSSKLTTVVDFTSMPPILIRQGEGHIKLFSL